MRSLTVSPFVAGDPVWPGPEVTTVPDLVAALEVPFLERPGLLQLVPGIALIHSLTGADGRVALRWVHLSHEPDLIRVAADHVAARRGAKVDRSTGGTAGRGIVSPLTSNASDG
jgi:hypothetical protein